MYNKPASDTENAPSFDQIAACLDIVTSDKYFSTLVKKAVDLHEIWAKLPKTGEAADASNLSLGTFLDNAGEIAR